MIPADANAPCAGKWELFESPSYRDHRDAASICARCHIFLECKVELEAARGGPNQFLYTGTWAGERFTNRGGKLDPTGRDASTAALHEYRARKAAGNLPERVSRFLDDALVIVGAGRGISLGALKAHDRRPEFVSARRVAYTACMLLGDTAIGIARAAERRHDTIRHALKSTTVAETDEAEQVAAKLRAVAA